MAGLAEAFTVLAVFEAVDKMSAALEKMDAGLDKFSETSLKAAESATEAGAKIDESLLKTASGADAVEVADARLAAARDKLTAASDRQAEAERALLQAQADAAAAADGDAAASQKLVAASDALTAAQKRTAAASKEVAAASKTQADVSKAAAAANDESAVATDVAAASQKKLGLASGEAAAGSGLASKAMKVGALAIAAIGYESIKAAGNFQSMTQHLVTDAGESQSNLAMVRSGMLQIATTTGTTTEQMAAGMYHIESAGFHGKQALDVLRTAAEGAKVGGADLDTIGQALTGTMNAFSKEGLSSTQMMNGLIATVGQGDMKLQDLGSSMGNVAAIGASAGLKFSQIAGAVATMTAQNVSAQRATQDLAHTISSMSNPTTVQTKEMSLMGLNAVDVSKNLGKNGLTGTIDILVQAIAAHTKGGEVFVDSLNKSKAAAQQASQALTQMPTDMKKLAESWQNGTTSTKDFNKAIQALPPAQQTLYTQFEALVKKSGSFTAALQANNPTAQTFNAALAKMTGGTTSLNTILMLSGAHSQTFKDNVDKIQGSVSKTGSSVENWDKIQGTFNQKMDRLKASVEATGISIGTALLPVVSKIASAIVAVVTPIAQWIAQHQTLATVIIGSIGGLLGFMGAVAAVKKTISAVSGTIETVTGAFNTAKSVAAGIGPAMSGIASGFSSAAEAAGKVASSAGSAISAGVEMASTWAKSGLEAVVAAGRFVIMKGAQLAVAVAAKAQAAAQWLLNAAMDANPITLIIIALVALAAGFAYLWTHSAGFRDFWISAWHDIQGAAETVWGWLQDAFHGIMSLVDTVVGFVRSHWQLLLGIITGPIGIAVMLITHYWGQIKQFFMDGVHAVLNALEFLAQIPNKVTGWMVGMVNAVGHGIASVINWFLGLPGQLWNIMTGLYHSMITAGSNILIGVWNGLVSMASWLYNKVMGLVKDIIPGPILKVLGINSPSRWAHWAGQMVGHGLANGITSTHDKVMAASTQLASAITKGGLGAVQVAGAKVSGALTATISAPRTSAVPALAGAGTSGGGLYINVDLRNSKIANGTDAKAMAQQIGNEVVRELARAGIKPKTF